MTEIKIPPTKTDEFTIIEPEVLTLHDNYLRLTGKGTIHGEDESTALPENTPADYNITIAKRHIVVVKTLYSKKKELYEIEIMDASEGCTAIVCPTKDYALNLQNKIIQWLFL